MRVYCFSHAPFSESPPAIFLRENKYDSGMGYPSFVQSVSGRKSIKNAATKDHANIHAAQFFIHASGSILAFKSGKMSPE